MDVAILTPALRVSRPWGVVLICGYKRSGKDTLYQRFPDWDYVSLYTRDGGPLPWLRDFEPKPPRMGFADALQKQTLELLKLPAAYDFELKDTTIVHGRSVREHMKDIAREHRGRCDTYYADIVRDAVGKAAAPLVIATDWRYKTERAQLEKAGYCVPTVRVFRKDVPIPPASDSSEHQLDTETTDVLVLPALHTDQEWSACIAQFPQYSSYVPFRRITSQTQ